MIVRDIEGGRKETSDIIRVSTISDSSDISVSLYDVGVGRSISRVGSWFGIILIIEHTYVCETSVMCVGVLFDAEAMRGIVEVPSLSMELLCANHLVLDPRLVFGVFTVLE